MISAPILFKPDKPGAFASLPFDDYWKAPGINCTALGFFHDCPRDYQQYRAGKIPCDPTAEMIFGKVGHARVLEGKRDYYVRPATYPANKENALVRCGEIKAGDPVDWNGNATWCKKWLADHSDKEVLSPERAELIDGIADYIRAHPKASRLLAAGQPEVSMFAVDPQTRLLLKGRPDWITADGAELVDAKFLADVSRQALPRTIIKRRYHVQLAMYRRLCGLNGIHPKTFWILAVEKVPWGKINLRPIPKAIIDVGEIELDRDLALLKACMASGIWPDPSGAEPDEESELVFPNWAYFPEGEDSDEPLTIGGEKFTF